MAFALHPRLAADTHRIAALAIADVLLMNDARYPWCILVPRIDAARELHELPRDVAIALQDEVRLVAATLARAFTPDKMNVAALGNQVPQLHVHVIARRTDDPAWPAPVWGVGQALPYAPAAVTALLELLRRELAAAPDPA